MSLFPVKHLLYLRFGLEILASTCQNLLNWLLPAYHFPFLAFVFGLTEAHISLEENGIYPTVDLHEA